MNQRAVTAECSDYPIPDTSNHIERNEQVAINIGEWISSKPSGRKCGMSIHLQNESRRHEQMIVGVLCGCWSCKVCGPYLQDKWLRHLSEKLDIEDTIYALQIPISRWETYRMRIVRAGGEYARIELESGVLVVFTNAPVGKPIEGDLSAVLKLAISSVTFSHKPISTSRGWKLSGDGRGSFTGRGWKRIGQLSATVEEAEKVVRSMGVSVHTFCHIGKYGFYIHLPYEWDDDKIREFACTLGRLIPVEEASPDYFLHQPTK